VGLVPVARIAFVGALSGAVVSCNGMTKAGGAPGDGTSCGNYYDAITAYYSRCEPKLGSASLYYGDRARFVTHCTAVLAAPGVSSAMFDSALDACAGRMLSPIACGDTPGRNTACTTPAGSYTTGTACGEDAQCASGYCKRAGPLTTGSEDTTTPTFGCGVCTEPIAIGRPCVPVDDRCVVGTSCLWSSETGRGTCGTPVFGLAGDPCNTDDKTCDDGFKCDAATMTCIAYGAAGAECKNDLDCQYPLVCTGNDSSGTPRTCGTGGDVGAACLPGLFEDECKTGLLCDTTSKTCIALKYAGPGEPCDSETMFCTKGWCYGDDAVGTCPTMIQDGAPCDPNAKDAQCDTFAHCVNGRCQVFDPSSCK
jgi:hypothetical protein